MFFLSLYVVLISIAYPCAPAPPEGMHLVVTKEEALIIWDGQIQHFVRRGAFESDADDFGFLVPTPSKPQLAEVPDEILTKLHHQTKAKRVIKEYWRPDFFPLLAYPLLFTAGDGSPVKSIVVEQVKVAGMDAAVLKAEDSADLAAWLVKNNYPFRPELKEWVQHYIAQGWYLTAFKIDKGGRKATNLESQLIHMQFASKRPFFPYKEPQSATLSTGSRRSLRVYMISPQPPAPQLGDGSTKWGGKVVYAKAGNYQSLFQGAALAQVIPKEAWLSELEDDSNPRPGIDDLWLDANPTPQSIERKSIVLEKKKSFPLPVDVLLVFCGMVFWWLKKR